MNRTDPPWARPAGARAAAGGGAIEVRRQTIGNNGTQNQRLRGAPVLWDLF